MPRDLERLFFSAEETEEPEIGQIIGKIPDVLIGGVLLRNGPGLYDLNSDFSFNHLLDGYAILSKFEINAKSIKLTKRFLNSESYTRAKIAKRPVIAEFATKAYPDPSKNIFLRHIPDVIPPLTDNGNISIYSIDNRIFCANETNFFREVCPNELSCLGDKYNTLKLFGMNSTCAHPLVDQDDGTAYFLGNSVYTGLKYKIMKVPQSGTIVKDPPSGPEKMSTKNYFKNATTLCTIPSSFLTSLSVAYIHTFAMSKNYIIFCEQPLTLNVRKVATSSLSSNASEIDWLDWHGETVTNRFFIIDKHTGKVHDVPMYSEKSFFFLHMVNAYEEDIPDKMNGRKQIVLDIMSFPNADFLLKTLQLQRLRANLDEGACEPFCQRYLLPLIGSKDFKIIAEGENCVGGKGSAIKTGDRIILKSELLLESGVEFPMINQKFQSKKNKYFYCSGSASNGLYKNSICKFDTFEKKSIIWRESESYFPGEPVFVENKNGVDEDSGFLLITVTDSRKTEPKDFLLILDAKTMKELARVYFKSRIHFDFHGIFYKNKN